MTYEEIAALLPEALQIHQLSHDPLALDAIRVLQEALVDSHCTPEYKPTALQKTVFAYMQRMMTARDTLAL